MGRRVGLWLPTDPPGLPPAPPTPRLFDARPHRNRGIPGIAYELEHPNDDLLIATAMALGCHRDYAEQIRYYPPARLGMFQLWCRVHDAARGDAEAKEAIDRCRIGFESAAKNRVGEALDAREQPADAAELQSLMGLD
jgi:hypothetical protein